MITSQHLFERLPALWVQALCAALLAISMADIMYRRVGNLLVSCCMAWGFLAHAVVQGPKAALLALIAGAVGFAAALPLYACGGMGAADVKLVAALSVCAGLAAFPSFILYTAIAAGVMGLWRLSRDGKFLRPPFYAMILWSGTDALNRARSSHSTLPLAVALSVGLGLALRQRG